MPDKIVIVGQEIGDDYTTVAAAEAAVPSDLTLTSGNHIIQIRADQPYDRIVSPVIIDDATHHLAYQAFPGDEVNGKGVGASIIYAGSQYVAAVALKNSYDSVEGLRIEHQTTTSPASAVKVGNDLNTSIDSCYIKSGVYGFNFPNGWSGELHLTNSILAECGNHSIAVGSIAGTINLDKVTSVKSGGQGFQGNQYGAGSVVINNSIGIGNTSVDYENSADPITGSFNASGDATAKGTFPFLNRTITDDLVDPNGVTPDYSLSATSTLKGAGSGGSDIGATLGSITEIVGGTEQPIAIIQAEQATQSELVTITALNNLNIIVAESLAQAQLSNLILDNQISTVIAEQKTDYSLYAIANINALTSVVTEQLTQSVITDINDAQLITAVQAQQFTQALTVNVTSSGAQDINVVVSEQYTQAQVVSPTELQQLQAVITEQLTQAINADIHQSLATNAVTVEQISQSVIVSVDESSGIFVSVVQTEQLTQAINANIDVATLANTVISEQLTQYATQQINVDLTVSAVISEQLTQAELITVIVKNLANKLNIDIDQISLEILTPTYNIESLTPVYTIKHLH